jgi:hypothetical protein
MRSWLLVVIILGIYSASGLSQTPRRSTARKTTVPVVRSSGSSGLVDKGLVSGRTYTNATLGLSVTFPDTWLIGDDAFFAYMKSKGFDLTPKPPKAATPAAQAKVNAAFNRLKILITLYRSLPGTPQNGVLRIAAESVSALNTTRPVKDAVDYVDLMRSQIAAMQMPADFKYSETQAEQLGPNQFAYMDTSDKQGKTRMYVTIRRGYAILFTLNYSADDDLATLRQILAAASFTK